MLETILGLLPGAPAVVIIIVIIVWRVRRLSFTIDMRKDSS